MTTTEFLTTLQNQEVDIFCGEWIRGKITHCMNGVVTLKDAEQTVQIRAENILGVSATNNLIS